MRQTLDAARDFGLRRVELTVRENNAVAIELRLTQRSPLSCAFVNAMWYIARWRSAPITMNAAAVDHSMYSGRTSGSSPSQLITAP